MRKLLATCLTLSLSLVLFTTSASAQADGAPVNERAVAANARGFEVLTQGDFDAARAAFIEAAKADPANLVYRKQIALVSRMQGVRKQLDVVAEDAVKWEASAQSLRTFYLQYEVFGEAVKLDEARHARFCTPATAIDLSESYLEAYQNAKAAKVLGALAADQRTVRANVMLGIAAAREGELDLAKRLSAKFGEDAAGDGVDIQLLYDRACLSALVGDLDVASDQLRRCYEAVPAASLLRLKSYTKTRKDLDGLRTPAYAAVFDTVSKVEASGCAGCSSAATCGKAKTDGGSCDDEGETKN